MERDPSIPLDHILDAIDGIDKATEGKSFDTCMDDWVVRHAIQRGIEIVSEAARRIPDNLADSHPEINWKQVRGIGNILRHDYHNIQDEVIWDVVKLHLPRLKAAVLAMKTWLQNEE